VSRVVVWGQIKERRNGKAEAFYRNRNRRVLSPWQERPLLHLEIPNFLNLPDFHHCSCSHLSLPFPVENAMLSTILGFSAFGLAARFGQLAIQRRPLLASQFR
jgi:hypothetical protein